MNLPTANYSNQFLVAMPGQLDDVFQGAVVYVCEHTEQGALGLVINKPVDITLKHLFDKIDLHLNRPDWVERPVFFGGPVQTERGFVLHEDLGDDAPPYASMLRVQGGLVMTTSKDVLEAIAADGGPQRVLVTLGYAGWTAGQLEDEMSRNVWISTPVDHRILFETPIEDRYDAALALLGIRAHQLQSGAGHA